MCEHWIMLGLSDWNSKQEARDVPQVLFSSLVSLPKLEQPAVIMFLAGLNDSSTEERLHRIMSCFPVTSIYLKLPQPLRKWPALEENYWVRLNICFSMFTTTSP